MRRSAAVALALTAFAAAPASAHPERYFVCHDEAEAVPASPAPARAKPPDDWRPLRRRRPPTLELAKLEVFDVPESDPMPSRRVAEKKPSPPLEQPPVVALESKNTFYCIGIPRGTPGILRAVAAPPGTRFWGHPYVESWRQENMQAAGELGIARARALLRRELDRPLPKGIEAWEQGELVRSKAKAATALADLGDTASAGRVLAFLRTREKEGFNLWRDTLGALPRLDPSLAQSYALELIDRAVSDPKWLAENPQLYTDLLPLVTLREPKALATLRRASGMLDKDDVALPHGGGGCEFLAARVRLGDALLVAELRGELNTASLTTERAVECYSTLMPVLYPGVEASEIEVLTYRHRYDSILAWLEATRTAQASAELADARKRLKDWLVKRSKDPDVGGDRSLRDYSPETRAKHLAALAALGDSAADKALDHLIADAKDEGTAPWVAAYWALRLELAGAPELAAKRLVIAFTQHTERFSTELWPTRGNLTLTEHGRVIDELVRRGDDRFVLGLLDREEFTRDVAVSWLAQKLPASACTLVADAAHLATPEAVDEAFWALSLLGDRCRATMQRLVDDPRQPKEVRGMANEHLAMLRDKSVPSNSAKLGREQQYGASVERARIIYHAPE